VAGVVRVANFDLKGGVVDAEVVVDVVGEVEEEVVAGVSVRHDEVGGEGGFGGAHCPDVEVVNLGDTGAFCQEGTDGEGFDSFGDGIQGEVDGVFEQLPGADHDDQNDDQADDGVNPLLPSEDDRHPRQHHSSGNARIRCHVQKCATNREQVTFLREKLE